MQLPDHCVRYKMSSSSDEEDSSSGWAGKWRPVGAKAESVRAAPLVTASGSSERSPWLPRLLPITTCIAVREDALALLLFIASQSSILSGRVALSAGL